MVELIALLSNPANQQEWRELLEEADQTLEEPTAVQSPRGRGPRQTQRRLERTEMAALVKGYKAGDPVLELAVRFGIHRNTVRDIVRSHGVPPRRRGLSEQQVCEATELYVCGKSVAWLGERFNVHATTVWRALRISGVQLRQR